MEIQTNKDITSCADMSKLFLDAIGLIDNIPVNLTYIYGTLKIGISKTQKMPVMSYNVSDQFTINYKSLIEKATVDNGDISDASYFDLGPFKHEQFTIAQDPDEIIRIDEVEYYPIALKIVITRKDLEKWMRVNTVG